MKTKSTDLWADSLRRLGLSAEASWEQIQARYRRLVLDYHPDVNTSPEAASFFRKIAAAYETLDALRREHRARSMEDMIHIYDDPRIRMLSPEELRMRLRYSSSPKVRGAAAYLLGNLGGEDSRKILLQAGKDLEEPVRQVIVEALGKVGRPGDLLRLICLSGGRRGSRFKVFLRSSLQIWGRALKGLTSAGWFGGRDNARERTYA
ncbi:MAG: DnaJ domain-containing protein [Spirochaetaceae bacterium]|nr:MAG: DnaJ domain-containing protein [Spirochaetaceae bacterium]